MEAFIGFFEVSTARRDLGVEAFVEFGFDEDVFRAVLFRISGGMVIFIGMTYNCLDCCRVHDLDLVWGDSDKRAIFLVDWKLVVLPSCVSYGAEVP